MAAGRLALFFGAANGDGLLSRAPAEAYHSRFRTAKPADEHRGSVRSAARR
jgi:hypothetical protein